MEGETLDGRFVIGRLAGAGAMGRVYRAVDQAHDGRSVAIKVMPSQGGDDAARFLREAHILEDLAHPHVVGYVARGRTPTGQPWLAMEWLEGEDLAARLSRGPLGEAETLRLATLVAETLYFVHARGIVHRDLKPSNIFLPHGDVAEVRVLDFGIAHLASAERMTNKGTLLGTPGYMAPEQVHGTSAIDARADVYALGCILFECLTGEPLFAGASVLATLAKIVLEPAPRLRDWLPAVPEALEELVARMLAKDPAARPNSAAAVATALGELSEVGAGEGVRGNSSSSSPSFWGPSLSGLDPDAPPRYLTGGERRAVAVILVGAGGVEPRGDAPTAKPDTINPATEALLRSEASAHGGRLVRLLSGAVAVELTGPGLVTDLAAQAARCALSLLPLAEGRPVALALGRSETSGQLPRGPAIDRGARLIASHLTADGARSPDPASGSSAVLLDDVLAGLLDARFDVREEAGPGGFVLRGERPIAEGTRTLLGKATPCVGRDRELGILDQLFEECVSESTAQAVLVTAHAGVGKSRLAQELLRLVRDRTARSSGSSIWIGRGDSLRAGSPFGMLGQVLRGACDVREGAALEERREKLRARVAGLFPEPGRQEERTRVTLFLGELLGAPFSDEDSLPLRAARKDASLMHEQMREAFLSFLDAACASQPVFIVLEDLHWGDQPTVQFVDRALTVLRQRPLFVLALARPAIRTTFPGLWAERGSHEIHLKELGPRPIERLVRHVLGDGVGPGTIERLARLSDGNAFYLEELIRWAAERRDSELPETVVMMVQSRLGALDEATRAALRVASIFGEVFWSGAVGALLGGRERTTSVRDRLRELAEHEVLVRRSESRFPGEDEYAFRHALLREGAYAMLTDHDRALGHLLAAEWLEAHGEGEALVLAEHFEKGGDGARAGTRYLEAARRASAGSDTVQALDCIKRGLALPLPRDLKLKLLGMRWELHMYRIELALPGQPEARELLSQTEEGSLAWTQALLIVLIGAAMTQDDNEISQVIEKGLAAEFQPEALEVATMFLGFGSAFSDHAGRTRQGGYLVKRAETLISRANGDIGTQLFFHLIVTTRAAFADENPWSGLEHAERALALARSIGHRRYTLGSQMLVLVNSCFLGAYEQVRRAATETEVPDHEFGLSSSVRPFVLAWHLADLGELEGARAWAERLLADGRARGRPLDEGRGHWALAEVLRRAGDLEAAASAVDRALAMSEKVCALDVPGVLATRAALYLGEGRHELALVAAEDSLAKYRSSGACGMFRAAFLQLTHAEALHAVGRPRDAAVAIVEAERHLLANADKILDAAFRASFLEQVPENRRTLELARDWAGVW